MIKRFSGREILLMRNPDPTVEAPFVLASDYDQCARILDRLFSRCCIAAPDLIFGKGEELLDDVRAECVKAGLLVLGPIPGSTVDGGAEHG
jgi:hypothetical protein